MRLIKGFFSFIALFIVMNFIIAWALRLLSEGFGLSFTGWVGSDSAELTTNRLADVTFISALVLTTFILLRRRWKKKRANTD